MANVAYLTVMTPLEILTSNAVAVTFANRVLGVMAWIVPFSVACSTFGGATGSSFSAARVFHASARQGHMVKAFSYISISRSTPFPPILLQASIALLMIAVGGITSLIDYMSFITWFFLALSFMSVLVFRITKKDEPRPYRVPTALPILMFLVAITLLILPIVLKPQLQFLYAVLTVFTGVFFYVPFIHYRKPVYGLDLFSRLMISCCRIAPPETVVRNEKVAVTSEYPIPIKV
ncbi:hypothetical protein RvY_06860-2 [Ramazzottius varieornatus]|uniref:Cationic amino acid transporter C-terminal domain-containing protein n=1 Tax=Ramazzottius varieornatus TaxID=947166 RepID=A0A1D1V5B7_RAMVA|nr:hypothetical protein RvY_06860-2 [Ramazzottius varieornatus]